MGGITVQDENRFDNFSTEHEDIILDYSRQKLTPEGKGLLLKLAERAQVKEKMVVL